MQPLDFMPKWGSAPALGHAGKGTTVTVVGVSGVWVVILAAILFVFVRWGSGSLGGSTSRNNGTRTGPEFIEMTVLSSGETPTKPLSSPSSGNGPTTPDTAPIVVSTNTESIYEAFEDVPLERVEVVMDARPLPPLPTEPAVETRKTDGVFVRFFSLLRSPRCAHPPTVASPLQSLSPTMSGVTIVSDIPNEEGTYQEMDQVFRVEQSSVTELDAPPELPEKNDESDKSSDDSAEPKKLIGCYTERPKETVPLRAEIHTDGDTKVAEEDKLGICCAVILRNLDKKGIFPRGAKQILQYPKVKIEQLSPKILEPSVAGETKESFFFRVTIPSPTQDIQIGDEQMDVVVNYKKTLTDEPLPTLAEYALKTEQCDPMSSPAESDGSATIVADQSLNGSPEEELKTTPVPQRYTGAIPKVRQEPEMQPSTSGAQDTRLPMLDLDPEFTFIGSTTKDAKSKHPELSVKKDFRMPDKEATAAFILTLYQENPEFFNDLIQSRLVRLMLEEEYYEKSKYGTPFSSSSSDAELAELSVSPDLYEPFQSDIDCNSNVFSGISTPACTSAVVSSEEASGSGYYVKKKRPAHRKTKCESLPRVCTPISKYRLSYDSEDD